MSELDGAWNVVCRVETKFQEPSWSWHSSSHLPLHNHSLVNDTTINQLPPPHPQFTSTQHLGRLFRTQIRSTSFMIYRFPHTLAPDHRPISSPFLCPLTYYSHIGFLGDLPGAIFHVPSSQLTHILFPCPPDFPIPTLFLLPIFAHH